MSVWVPILTSEAGLSLTQQNWQAVSVSAASFYLDSLLLKPGLKVLNTVQNLAAYVNWSGPIILNASRLKANKEGIITLVSPYDGSKMRFNYQELIDLIHHLKPSIVIMPADIPKDFPHIWDTWDERITPYLSRSDLVVDKLPSNHGVYCTIDNDIGKVKEYLKASNNLPLYIQGTVNVDLIHQLSSLNVHYIESNDPAQLGTEGIVYINKSTLDVKDTKHSLEFKTITEQCACPTCSTQLTKAYLHHLYLHTPLLCQRFLIQHNVWHVQNSLRK